MAETVLTPAHNGQTVTVGAGDTIIVRLPENPTTGYRWEFAGDGAPGGDEFLAGSPGAPGAGGERIVRFRAPASGTLHIVAELRRAWETGGTPQSQFTATISVQ